MTNILLRVCQSVVYCASFTLVTACSIPSPTLNHYALRTFGPVPSRAHPAPCVLLVSQPSALLGYDTASMLYVNKPYRLGVFANNSWLSPPASMLWPLIVQSIQSSHCCRVVSADLAMVKADYRLETQLLNFEQNFLVKPSQLRLAAQVTLLAANRPVATKVFTIHIPCQADTPYAGVLAANQAAAELTRMITRFVIKQLPT